MRATALAPALVWPPCPLVSCRFTALESARLLSPCLSPSLAKFMRRTQAATIIQKYRRMYVEKKRYRQKQAAALAMQTVLRGYMARQKYQAVSPCFFVFFFPR